MVTVGGPFKGTCRMHNTLHLTTDGGFIKYKSLPCFVVILWASPLAGLEWVACRTSYVVE